MKTTSKKEIQFMTPALLEVLKSAGWNEAREIPTLKWVTKLKEDGLQVIPDAVRIIASFGGITFRPTSVQAIVYQPPVFFLDPTIPGGGGDVDRIPDWELRLGIKINPIGDLSGGHATLLFAEDGRILASLDDLLYFYGESFEDALENTLVFGKRVPYVIGDLRSDEATKSL